MKTTPDKIKWLRDQIKHLDDEEERSLAEGVCDDLEELWGLRRGIKNVSDSFSHPEGVIDMTAEDVALQASEQMLALLAGVYS
jgi:hypothetical protein